MKTEPDEPNVPLDTFAMVSVYSKADTTLLKESSDTLRVIDYEGL